MEKPALRIDGPDEAPVTLLLAHGAGAPMDSPFMDVVARGLAQRGIRVARFEFPYMAARRAGGGKRPPDRMPVLRETFLSAFAALAGDGPVAVGGKSMGGRVASLIADEVAAAALICLGYPFHPPGRPEKSRTAHLADIATPTLIIQGTRDPFGRPEEVATYSLADGVTLAWAPDGDHDLKPRKAAEVSHAQNLDWAVSRIAAFLEGVF